LNVSKETLTAFGPEAEVDLGHVFTSNVNWILEAGQFEDVFGHLFDVVATVADDSAQRRLANFSQLFRFEHARILVPEPAHIRQKFTSGSDRNASILPRFDAAMALNIHYFRTEKYLEFKLWSVK